MTAAHEPGRDPAVQAIGAMLHPASVAIVGATERLGYGGRLLNNLITTGSKARLYPVNPKRDEVFGVKCYRAVEDLPEAVDLAAIILPAEQVLPAFRQCVAIGARSALIISAGFAELGTAEGIARQAELRALARESGVRVCGPNCLGIANVADVSWTTSSKRIAPQMQGWNGGIAVVSQSGATAYRPLLNAATDRQIGFRYLIATGNEADLESSDFMRYMLHDPGVKAIAAVIESFKEGANFVRTAKLALEVGKPIVVLKIGRSEAGRRGASSHTAAMTGSDAVHDALFVQNGVIRVDDYDELLETADLFAKARAPRGNRVGVVSESGGMGSFMADKCGEVGLEVPPLSEATRGKLVEIMGERGSAANPADLTMFGTDEALAPILDHFLHEDNQDLVIMSSVGGELQARIAVETAAKTDKPFLYVWTGSVYDERDRAGLDLLRASRVPTFYLPGKAARAAKRLLDFHRTRERVLADEARLGLPACPDSTLAKARALLERAQGGALSEHESKRLLALFGVAVTRETLCASALEAVQAANEIGYPVALKVSSPQLGHKTEAGGVHLGIADAGALQSAYGPMMASVRARAPQAQIEGVLVQPMLSGGVELIVGLSQDAQFGPVLMLGMGGVLAEALAATSWRLCPITPREARDMIGEIRGLATILAGYRGRPPADLDALVATLVAVSRLAVWTQGAIASLDINPLTVLPQGRGALALDALVVTHDAREAGASAAGGGRDERANGMSTSFESRVSTRAQRRAG